MSYNPSEIESKYYSLWEKDSLFIANKDLENSYCIVLPPPNVTGSLHMGHAFQNVIMDAYARYNRLIGKSVLWQPGIDHAGIATQMVVERLVNSDGLKKEDLGRDAFIDRIWEWKEKSGDQITEQMKRLGSSVDWSRSKFTMDPDISELVTEVFIQLFEEKLIYKGLKLVNWDTQLQTALSDLEVISQEENVFLYEIKYPIKNSNDFLVVATTRPETMFGDVAVAVNPDDEKYKDFIGKEIQLPLSNRIIPVISDDYVDVTFGTGCLKITPAHDFNDNAIGVRHQLKPINILNTNGTLNALTPKAYQKLSVSEARKKVLAELTKKELLVNKKPYKTMIPRGDRSNSIIEPLLTDQWYVSVKEMADQAIDVVKNGDVKFIPRNWEKTYFNWMEDIQDWCISRQLWWGHRIPAWYDDTGNIYVGKSIGDIKLKYNLADGVNLTQDESVLDTWFSSSLWPFATLGWKDKAPEFDKFYPTSVLVTGFDIIFFWVARMIMMGLKFTGKVPFKEVYIHGLVRDASGQKMSKSKGNVLDPIDLIDGITLDSLLKKRTEGLMQTNKIEQIKKQTLKDFPKGIDAYGGDALRFTLASLATTGRDINLSVQQIESKKNFCNKIWNAANYILSHEQPKASYSSESLSIADEWIITKLHNLVESSHRHYAEHRLDLLTKDLYDFVWHDFCDWYIEVSKITMKSDHVDQTKKAAVYHTLRTVLESALKLLHPIIPFITEDLYQKLTKKEKFVSIMESGYPRLDIDAKTNESVNTFEFIKEVVSCLRQCRSENKVAPKAQLNASIAFASKSSIDVFSNYNELICSLANLASLISSPIESSLTINAVGADFRISMDTSGEIDISSELSRIQKLLANNRKDIEKLSIKLSNKKFIERAPKEVVQADQDLLASIQSRNEQLQIQLNKLTLAK
jgi:valyl-tRNA synthetase